MSAELVALEPRVRDVATALQVDHNVHVTAVDEVILDEAVVHITSAGPWCNVNCSSLTCGVCDPVHSNVHVGARVDLNRISVTARIACIGTVVQVTELQQNVVALDEQVVLAVTNVAPSNDRIVPSTKSDAKVPAPR